MRANGGEAEKGRGVGKRGMAVLLWFCIMLYKKIKIEEETMHFINWPQIAFVCG